MNLNTGESKNIVVILKSDPRQSHRSCEGIRIALGLASGGHQVEVIFSEETHLLLREAEHDEMFDGELARQFLDTLKDFISCFLIDRQERHQSDFTGFSYKVRLISREELASKVASSDCLFRF